MSGLQTILTFLDSLKERKIPFDISRQRSEALMVSFALVGKRIEVEFFEDHIEFSTFSGDEGVSLDKNELDELIARNWD